jgi:NADH-quinone oxidoreductase subunit J
LQHPFKVHTTTSDEPEIIRIGSELMDLEQSGWALPFETISILLLAALVGCIVIALKTTESTNNKNEQP